MRYKDLTIVCGINDSATKRPVDKIVEDCKATLAIAKTKALQVHISSILTRTDQRADLAKIETISQLLVALANEEEVCFVNNDNNFRYRDNTPDESLLLPGDNLHLTAIGTTRLLSNLGLADMAVSRLGRGPRSRCSRSKTEAQYTTGMPFPLTARAQGFPPSHIHNTNGIVKSQQAQHTAGMPNSFVPPQPPTTQRTTSSPRRK